MNRKKESIDYESLLEAIIKIDMYRDVKVTRFEYLESLLIRSGVRGVKEIIRELKTTIDRLVSSISKNKQFMRYSRWAAVLKFAATTGVLILALLVILAEMLKNPYLASIGLSYPFVLLAIVILPNAYLITDYYARTELRIMKERRSGRVSQLDKNLRDLNQRLINSLVTYAVRDKKAPKDLRFKLWHLDYEKVRVARKPWLLGRYWIVEPDIPEPEA